MNILFITLMLFIGSGEKHPMVVHANYQYFEIYQAAVLNDLPFEVIAELQKKLPPRRKA